MGVDLEKLTSRKSDAVSLEQLGYCARNRLMSSSFGVVDMMF